jgi:hypothetical protein
MSLGSQSASALQSFADHLDVYFHQYCCMTRCKPSMYNHFTALIPIGNLIGDDPVLNVLMNQVGIPWWKKTDEINGYDC